MNMSPSAYQTRAHDQSRMQYLQLTIVSLFNDVVNVHEFVAANDFEAVVNLEAAMNTYIMTYIFNVAVLVADLEDWLHLVDVQASDLGATPSSSFR